MPSEALSRLRERLSRAACGAGLPFAPERLTAMQRPHISLFAQSPENASALRACFLSEGSLCRAEVQGAFLRGDVSEAFLAECLFVLLQKELPPFVFPDALSEEALFSFPLYQQARLSGFARSLPGGPPAVPPAGTGRDLFWALLTAEDFPDPKKRKKPLLIETERFLSKLSTEERKAQSGLILAAQLGAEVF